MQPVVKPSKIALREGLIFGVGLGVLLSINFIVIVYANVNLSPVPSLLGLAAYFWAGMRASKITRVVSTGLLAGLFTAVISSVINLVIALIVTLLNVDTLRVATQKALDAQIKGPHTHYTNGSFIQVAILTLTFEVVLAALFGVGLGAAGGTVGRARAPLPTQSYEESMYQGTGTPPPAR
ncbi:MAG TPA: hypothetical protein VJN88_17030 [Ktedonobacterales bacterium]|nr:hypothetical protein [Ktedonobacterales bacterium]